MDDFTGCDSDSTPILFYHYVQDACKCIDMINNVHIKLSDEDKLFITKHIVNDLHFKACYHGDLCGCQLIGDDKKEVYGDVRWPNNMYKPEKPVPKKF